MNVDSTTPAGSPRAPRLVCFSRPLVSRAALPALALLVALTTASSAQEPAAAGESKSELEQILARHQEARGGLENLRAIESMKLEGRLEIQGMEIPFVSYRQRPNLYRTETELPAGRILQAYDGQQAWGVNPVAGVDKPAPLPADQAAVIVQQASFDGALVDPEKQGIELSLVGKKSLGGVEVYEIEATFPGGARQTIFLDANTYLEHERRATGVGAGQDAEVEIRFDAYTEVDGIQMLSAQTNVSPQATVKISVDRIELGAEIDESLFLMPGQDADEALTLEQILSRHLAARTDPAAAEIETVRATGKLGMMGFQLPLEMVFARPSSTRLVADMQGMQMVLAYDGDTAWTVSPLQGIPEPEALPPEAASAIALFSDFLWGLLDDHEAKGHQLSLEGVERVGRDETYRIVMTTASGESRELYLGGEDFLERKVHLSAVFLGADQEIDALLDDYRSIGGLRVPHQIEILAGGAPAASIALDGVELGVEVDPAQFALPETPARDPEP